MQVTRTRKFTVNMGNYESLATEASVTVDTDNYPVSLWPEKGREENVFDFVESLLDKALAADLEEAGRLTDVRTSFVLQDTTLTGNN